MTKENAKDFLPIVQALAEGKIIQYCSSFGKWGDIDDPRFADSVERYRIKPETEYIPFDTVEELIACWNQKKFNGNPPYNTELEMPLIWVKRKDTNSKMLITRFDDDVVFSNGNYFSYSKMFEVFTFLDGSPIGKIKE